MKIGRLSSRTPGASLHSGGKQSPHPWISQDVPITSMWRQKKHQWRGNSSPLGSLDTWLTLLTALSECAHRTSLDRPITYKGHYTSSKMQKTSMKASWAAALKPSHRNTSTAWTNACTKDELSIRPRWFCWAFQQPQKPKQRSTTLSLEARPNVRCWKHNKGKSGSKRENIKKL